MACIGDHGVGQFQFEIGERVRPGIRFQRRHRIIGGIEPVGVGVPQLRGDRLRPLVHGAVIGPHRSVFARQIESIERSTGLAIELLVRRRCAQRVAQPLPERVERELGRRLGGRRGGGARVLALCRVVRRDGHRDPLRPRNCGPRSVRFAGRLYRDIGRGNNDFGRHRQRNNRILARGRENCVRVRRGGTIDVVRRDGDFSGLNLRDAIQAYVPVQAGMCGNARGQN